MAVLGRIGGTSGDDDLFGDSRDDEIFGFGGLDNIYGRRGADLLDGGSGSDLIRGGRGTDSIWGGRGKDFLDGGPGSDDFWFDTRHRYDVIEDFSENDTLVIDTDDPSFEDVEREDIDIDGGSRFDKVYIDDDLIAVVFGDIVDRGDIVLI
jgi:Ca2+-binding RTX toxin-like protein